MYSFIYSITGDWEQQSIKTDNINQTRTLALLQLRAEISVENLSELCLGNRIYFVVWAKHTFNVFFGDSSEENLLSVILKLFFF